MARWLAVLASISLLAADVREASERPASPQSRLPPGFTAVAVGPFVVIGDESPRRVAERAARVRWTSERLERDFFERAPAEPIQVWTFKDEPSYRRHALELFGDRPTTPYGYYSVANRALVMNIRPGDGTLVHELVHPYMRANFPQCPAWLNEGLASLFERPTEVEGRIRGLVNWRLPGLQAALRAGTAPSLRELMAMTESEFYDDADGSHYGAARYLCLYLQEAGKLPQYVRELQRNHARDPDGVATLLEVLEEDDLEGLEGKWKRFVIGLRYR